MSLGTFLFRPGSEVRELITAGLDAPSGSCRELEVGDPSTLLKVARDPPARDGGGHGIDGWRKIAAVLRQRPPVAA
jgi:hypothetical protein